ncbi:MAG: efflux RND transporter periplasmic adaptor subunit [Alphaproteobacteria bacterium]
MGEDLVGSTARRLAWAATVVAGLTLFVGEASAQQGPQAALVEVDAVITEPLGQTTEVIGTLVATQAGVVAARVSGPVDEMRVDVGDRVKRGDVLAVLSNERIRAERDRAAAVVNQRLGMLETAQAELEKSTLEQRRLESLRESAAFNQARLEDVTQDVAMHEGEVSERLAQLDEARAQLSRAALDLADSEIRAPFDGVVTAKHIEVGAYLAIGNPVVTLLNDDELEVEAAVPSDRLEGLEPGSIVAFELDDGSRHTAVVRAVVPEENPLTRTRPVRFTPLFAGARRVLAANQSATVEIPIGRPEPVLTVAKDAVIQRGGRTIVYAIEDGIAQIRPVRLGEAVGGRFVVLGGLVEGESVVVRGNESLTPGQPIRVSAEDPPSAANGLPPPGRRGGG